MEFEEETTQATFFVRWSVKIEDGKFGLDMIVEEWSEVSIILAAARRDPMRAAWVRYQWVQHLLARDGLHIRCLSKVVS